MICFKNGLLGRELLELYSQINDCKMLADTENPQEQLCPVSRIAAGVN